MSSFGQSFQKSRRLMKRKREGGEGGELRDTWRRFRGWIKGRRKKGLSRKNWGVGLAGRVDRLRQALLVIMDLCDATKYS